MILLDGKKLATEIKENLKIEVEQLKAAGIFPKLVVIEVGNNFASLKYIGNKKKACEYVGIDLEVMEFDYNTSEQELVERIKNLNADKTVHGILVQMPLPEHIDKEKIINIIDPNKDVDGFNIQNVGSLSVYGNGFIPCTPYGIIELLDKYQINVCGKHCVVVGASNIVGKPISMLLLRNNATVTICHSKTKDLAEFTKQADVLVIAIGNPNFITADMIKAGVVIIDVGINRGEDNQICGDVDFEDCKSKASHITPVPGGVGVMTVAMLMKNCVKAAMGFERR